MAMFNGTNRITVRASQFEGLGFANTNPAGSALWRVVDLHDGDENARCVGPHYPTRAALLADLPRYAIGWGYV